MRMAVVLALSVLWGCAKTTAAPAAASKPAEAEAPKRAVAVGDRMKPISGPVAVPVKGAKLTMINYFATWCGSSKRWVPHVEAIRKKHAAAGLAVIGVANYDEASQAELEEFVKGSGGTYPVSTDPDRRIVNALPPSNFGQQIVIVDAKGVVRLHHVGTTDTAFDEVDAQIGQLLSTIP